MDDPLLDRFADWAGIARDWSDLEGNTHVTPPETKRALIAAMGHDAQPGAMRDRLEAEAAADSRLPREYVLASDRPNMLPLQGDGQAEWTLTLEDGAVMEGRASDGAIHLPALNSGYHILTIGAGRTLVLAAPDRAPTPMNLGGRARMWGVTAGLYALRSDRNAGFGDYADLAALGPALARNGADFLGLNPVHALGDSAAMDSPYSPSHRLFLDTRHIALDAVPELDAAPEARRLLDESAAARSALRGAPLIDYQAALALTGPIAQALFDGFDALPADHPRRQAFAAFRAERGEALESMGVYEALAQRHGADWRQWPEALRQPDSFETRAFAAAHRADVERHLYWQWLADEQLGAAQKAARDAGMALGLYTDLAVGVRPDGAETWAHPETFARGVSLGVPPDYFNADGQSWGLAPFNPVALREADYAPFIETIRAVARHAGMFRIDHVIGLQRCYWNPEDGSPGGYVAHSLDTLLAILRIEAWRSRCIVVGEDLGLVPAGLRERLRGAGVLGCSVMQFEREADESFRHPAQFAEATLASFGTHDTPTAAGYWAGDDIRQRRRIGQIDEAGEAAQEAARATDRDRLRGMTGDAGVETGAMIGAIHRALSQRGSALAAVQLADIAGQVEQPNMPGTVAEYPNWRVRDAVRVEDWENHPSLKAVSEIFGGRAQEGNVGAGGDPAD